MFFDIILSGISIGSIYAMLAVSVVIILKTTGVANFAQGELAMFSTFITYSLLVEKEFPSFLALVLTLIFAGIMGIVIQHIIIRPLLSSPIISTLIATLGLNLIIHSIAGMIWGYQTNIMPSLFKDFGSLTVGKVIIPMENIILIIVPLVLLSGFMLFL
ncbi:branched-chain amino acid ABC transporter permease, partial [Neobacillus niacini]|uniref:branched-chain amino acid ABC transporter permease n=1 Tax=Neobacillus niacini TaxID=86668 RepID=UPI002FFF1EA7